MPKKSYKIPVRETEAQNIWRLQSLNKIEECIMLQGITQLNNYGNRKIFKKFYFSNGTLFILNNQANNYPSIYLQSCVITELAKGNFMNKFSIKRAFA
jgi:hypothetical protein